MKILHLTLKREWFIKIKSGEKRTEFREIKPYWTRRLEGRQYDAISFRNGYATDAPKMLVEFLGLDLALSESGNVCYAIALGKILS
jgi:hypothetical protein